MMFGDRRDETTRYAHLDCPLATMMLDAVYRIAMHVSSTNARTTAELVSLSPGALVQKYKRALITGFRLSDVSRSIPTPPSQDDPFTNLIAETHTALIRNVRTNGMVSSFDKMCFDPCRIYDEIRRAMRDVTRHTLRISEAWEDRLRILQPGISFESANGERTGPIADWRKIWSAKGWATEDGRTLLPRSMLRAPQPHIGRCHSRVAWNTPAALLIALKWIERRRPASQHYSAHALTRSPDKWLCIVCTWMSQGDWTQDMPRRNVQKAIALPSTAVVYVDGSYNHAKGGGSQQAGFGATIIRGGDGLDDADASEVACLSGCVVLDRYSPVFLGAYEHTSSTGELSALMEGIWWLLEEDPTPSTSVLIRPDSEYTMGAATGDIQPDENVSMVQKLRRLYQRLLTQRKGKVKWAHVRSHTDHFWNDRADKLADVGATLQPWSSRVPGQRWRAVRLDGYLSPHRPLLACRGRLTYSIERKGEKIAVTIGTMPCGSAIWRQSAGTPPNPVMHLTPLQVDEPARVLRSRDAFGVLNLHPIACADEEIHNAMNKRIGLIDALNNDTCTVSDADRQLSRNKVLHASETLSSPAKRAQVIAEISTNPVCPKTSIRCPVDIDALDEYIAHPESNQRKKTRGLVSHTVRLQRGYVIVLPSPSPNLKRVRRN
jgi:ribonuclease HI